MDEPESMEPFVEVGQQGRVLFDPLGVGRHILKHGWALDAFHHELVLTYIEYTGYREPGRLGLSHHLRLTADVSMFAVADSDTTGVDTEHVG